LWRGAVARTNLARALWWRYSLKRAVSTVVARGMAAVLSLSLWWRSRRASFLVSLNARPSSLFLSKRRKTLSKFVTLIQTLGKAVAQR